MENLLNNIFPEICIVCNKPAYGSLCYLCTAKCVKLKNGFCVVCEGLAVDGVTHANCASANVPSKIFSCFEYAGVAAQCIKKSKYAQKEFAALKTLTAVGARWLKKVGWEYKGYVLVPVPVSAQRMRERGFNQSELISLVLAKELELKTNHGLLKRAKETGVQHALSKSERLKNMQGAFACADVSIAGRFLLIDDICTTGATLIESAKALYGAGANEVACFTLCRKV